MSTNPREDGFNAKDLGAKGDGTVDDYPMLQAALERAAFEGRNLYIPHGLYNISQGLLFRGTFAGSTRIHGEIGSPGSTGSVIQYTGAAGAHSVLELAGAPACEVDHLLLLGGSNAQFGLFVHSNQPGTSYNPFLPDGIHGVNDPPAGMGCGVSTLTLRYLAVGNVAGTNSACVSIGVNYNATKDNYQCDNISIERCYIQGMGVPPTTAYGITTGANNVKNFYLAGTTINNVGIGFAYGGSGTAYMSFGAGSANSDCDFLFEGGGNFNIDSWSSEGSNMFVRSSGGGSNGATLILRNCDVVTQGTAFDDIVINAYGYCEMTGCYLSNGSGGNVNQVPRVKLSYGVGLPCHFISQGNYYRNATVDYKDATGKPLFIHSNSADDDDAFGPTVVPSWESQHWSSYISTEGDYGGHEGAIVRMQTRGKKSMSVRVVTAASLASDAAATPPRLVNWMDGTLVANATAAPVAINLPDATKLVNGWSLTVKNGVATANAVTVVPAASQTVDGAAGDATVPTFPGVLRLQTNAGNWIVV